MTAALRRVRRLFDVDEWAIGVVDLPLEDWVVHALATGQVPNVPVRWFEWPGRGWFVADPHAFEMAGDEYAAYEIYDPLTGRGRIGVGRLGSNGIDHLACPIDDRRFHYAYPFIWKEGGTAFCIPDSSRRDGTPVFGLRSATHWEDLGLLQGVPRLSDPTVARLHGRLWLIGTTGRGPDEQLRCFYAEELLGLWRECDASPIASDGARRSAGRIVTVAGKVIRPTQDSLELYGAGIHLYELRTATADRFDNLRLATIRPHSEWPYSEGMHTLSGVGRWTLIDAYRHHAHPLGASYRGTARLYERSRRRTTVGHRLGREPPVRSPAGRRRDEQ